MINYNNRSALDKYSYILTNEPILVKRVATRGSGILPGHHSEIAYTGERTNTQTQYIIGQMSLYYLR